MAARSMSFSALGAPAMLPSLSEQAFYIFTARYPMATAGKPLRLSRGVGHFRTFSDTFRAPDRQLGEQLVSTNREYVILTA